MAEQKSNLDILLEQTSFLLEKHKESKEGYLKLFDDFLSVINREIEVKKNAGNEDEVKKLECVSKIVGSHLQEFKQAVDEDIGFLEDQHAGILEAKKQCDPGQEKQLFDLLMDGKELSDTEGFKHSVTQESTNSFESFSSIIADLNEVFKEGDIDQLLLYLESMVSSDDEAPKKEVSCTGQGDCSCEDCSAEITLEFESSDIPEERSDTSEEKKACRCSSDPEGGSCGKDCVCNKKDKS